MAAPPGLGAGRAHHVPAELLQQECRAPSCAFLRRRDRRRGRTAAPVPRGGPDVQHLPRHPERRHRVGEREREERAPHVRGTFCVQFWKTEGFFSDRCSISEKWVEGEELRLGRGGEPGAREKRGRAPLSLLTFLPPRRRPTFCPFLLARRLFFFLSLSLSLYLSLSLSLPHFTCFFLSFLFFSHPLKNIKNKIHRPRPAGSTTPTASASGSSWAARRAR